MEGFKCFHKISTDDVVNCVITYLASQNGHENIVEFMKNQLINIDVDEIAQFTSIYLAAQNGHLEILKHLLTKTKPTTLPEIDRKDKPILAKIVKKEIKLETKPTILPEINKKDNLKLPKIKLETKIISSKLDTNELVQAVRNGNASLINSILQNQNQFNLKDPIYSKLLLHAIIIQKMDVIEVLLKYGADVNYKTYGNRSVIHFAAQYCKNKNANILLELIKRGVDVNIKDDDGNRPIFDAIKGNNLAAINILLKNKASINAKNNKNESPLELAIFYNYKDILKCLLEYGADPNEKDCQGRFILYGPLEKGNKTVVQVLLGYGAVVQKNMEKYFVGHPELVCNKKLDK